MSVTALLVNVAEPALHEQRQALEDAGFAVVTASAFTEASALLTEIHPDLLVAPVRLGTHNGIHLAVRAQSLSPSTRVLILGYPDVVLERDATDAGAAYLAEPDVKTLVELARKLVRHPGGHTAAARRAGGGAH